MTAFPVMRGLDPHISIREALCHPKRDRRDKTGDDDGAKKNRRED
jgi:hypothetical protein